MAPDPGARSAPAASRSAVLRASPPMFASRRLDRVTRVHVAVVPALFVPVVAVQLVLALGGLSPVAVLAWVAGGYALWTLSEYWLHRVVFHFEPQNRLGARLHWMFHGVHHDHPNDPLRLVMPPGASLPLGAVFALAFHLLLGFAAACALGAGFFAGYLAYDLTHFALHHATPRTRLGRRLRENHMRHHFQDDTTAFGVSTGFWDRVFRTSRGVSPTARRRGRSGTPGTRR